MVTVCPIYRDVSVKQETSQGDRTFFECECCGNYGASRSLLTTTLSLNHRNLTTVQYAALSHRVRQAMTQQKLAMIFLFSRRTV